MVGARPGGLQSICIFKVRGPIPRRRESMGAVGSGLSRNEMGWGGWIAKCKMQIWSECSNLPIIHNIVEGQTGDFGEGGEVAERE